MPGKAEAGTGRQFVLRTRLRFVEGALGAAAWPKGADPG